MQEKKQATDVIRILQKHFNVYTDGDLAEKIGSTRSAISQWKVYDRIPKKILTKYHDLIVGGNEEIVVEAQTIHIEKGEEKVDANYIIGLQKEKIERQTVEIDKLKSALEHKEAESTHWDMIEYDYYVETKIHLKDMRFGRTINEVTNLELQSQKLGYTVNEMKSYWDIGKEHSHNEDLPIRKILDENTLKDINEKTRTFPAIFNTLKNIVGHHYIPMPVIYLHKNGNKVPAISYNKIKWSEMKVYSKVEYIKVD